MFYEIYKMDRNASDPVHDHWPAAHGGPGGTCTGEETGGNGKAVKRKKTIRNVHKKKAK